MAYSHMIIEQWLSIASQKVKSATPTLDAELLLCHYLDKNRAYLVAFAETIISDDILTALNTDLEKLADGYPLAYIIGKKDFWDMTLHVTEDTLIPRADTETLIETCQNILPADFTGSILDLGTGSGAIAIALNRVFPNATITATDISEKTLSVAKENAKKWQITPISFIHADWFTPVDNTNNDNKTSVQNNTFQMQIFDVIASNPPYIIDDDPHLNTLTHEPLTALTACDNGLADIKTIINGSQKKLSPNGWLVLEHGYDQGKAVRDLFANSGNWKTAQTIRDLGGNERITYARLNTNKPQSH